ncbi:hypothetical protein [Kitasatospora sp. NPDC051914]|uniref:hypothetical protein n=1 Tax=Kitasatospora sp. NPDC051914 TaxID=3154945 RepID=UPI00341EDAD5
MSGNKPARSGSTALGRILTIGLNVVAPILTYDQLVEHGHSEVTALLLSGLWPIADVVVYRRSGGVDGALRQAARARGAAATTAAAG